MLMKMVMIMMMMMMMTSTTTMMAVMMITMMLIIIIKELKVVFHSRMNFFLLVGKKLFLLHYINHQVTILFTPLIDTPLLR